MQQLHIRHCTLRLRRHDGWSWGADPNHLVRMATQALPELIANKLSQLLVDQKQPLTINHLRLTIPVKMSELSALHLAPDTDMANSLLSDRISQQLEQALVSQAEIVLSQSVESTDIETTNNTPQNLPMLTFNNDGISLLLEWYQQGTLTQILKYFSAQACHDWEQLVLKSLPETVVEVENYQLLLTEAEQCCLSVMQSQKKQVAIGVKRLVLLTALLKRYPDLFSRQTMTDLLDRNVSVDTDSTKAPNQHSADGELVEQFSKPESVDGVGDKQLSIETHKPIAAVNKKTSSQSFQVNVSSVLPFVSLGILSRFGYFDVLATALNASDIHLDAQYFAVAFAYKMLTPPHRGWHRNNIDLSTAAAVAGLHESVAGEQLDRFALSSQHCLSPIDGYLQRLLTEGHDPSRALLIHQLTIEDHPVWLLLDSQGCFPIAWFSNQQVLLQTLEDFAGNTFLISDAAAQAVLFKQLSGRQYRFITTLPPGRQDQWKSIDRRRLFWTNDLQAQTSWLLKQSQGLADIIARADDITQALLVDRPLLTNQSQQLYAMQFEQSLALAASSALATIAWQLWGENEATDPILTLERLGNLEGKVIFDNEKITVRPALGRRYQDLYDNHLLVDVDNIPWFGGRRMEFAGA